MMGRITIASILLCTLWLTAYAGGGPEPDPGQIARAYVDARKASLAFPEIFANGQSHSDASLYAVQRQYVELLLKEEGLTVGGYKGGFIPKASVGGVLFAEGILKGTPTLKRSNFYNLLVEAEIAFQFCDTIEQPLADVAALQARTCNVFPAIELPDAALENLDDLLSDFSQLRQALVPTNMGVAKVLIGEAKNPQDLDLNRVDINVAHNGTKIGYREGASSTSDIWSRVLWVVNDFVIGRGYKIDAGHIIIPGALTGLHQGKPGQYNVDYGSLGAVEFRIEP